MSLKTILNNLIAQRGYVSSEEVYHICQEEGFKLSNAERRLRRSESPNVEPVMAKSKRGTMYIKGYKFIVKVSLGCYSCGKSANHTNQFGYCDECAETKQKVPSQLFTTKRNAITL